MRVNLAICLAILSATVVISGCSKSPTDAINDGATAIGHKLMDPLYLKDASAQAERMITMVLLDKPECEVFKTQMREAGKGSPYEATTARGFVITQQEACKANCCKP